jgi:hypothetical protein
MRLFGKSWLPLTALLLLPALAVAGETAKSPAVVVRVRSIDAVFEAARLGANLVGKGDIADQLVEMVKNREDGIDLKKPIGFYGQVGKDLGDATGVLLLPVSSEKNLIDALNGFNIQPQKGADGVYTVELPNVPVKGYLRFSQGYAYITALKREALDKGKLPSPKDVFSAVQDTLVSASIRLDQIPEGIKGVFLDQLDLKLAEALEKKEANETPAQKELRVKVQQALGEEVRTLVRDGGAVEAAFDVDVKSKRATLEASLKGKSGTKLARQIAGLAEQKSQFAGQSADVAMSGLLHLVLPEKLSEALGKVIHEGIAEGLKKEKDESKRRLAEKALKAIEPALRSGELDAGFGFRGPDKDGRYTALFGFQVKNATEVAKVVTEAFQEAIKNAPAAEREKIKLNALQIDGTNVHRLDFQDKYDDKARKLFGANPLLVTFSDKAFLLAVGPEAEAALRQAIKATPSPAPVARLDLNYGRLAQAALLDEADRRLAKKILGSGEAGVLNLTVQGGPSLRIRFDANLGLLQFFAEKNKDALGGQ